MAPRAAPKREGAQEGETFLGGPTGDAVAALRSRAAASRTRRAFLPNFLHADAIAGNSLNFPLSADKELGLVQASPRAPCDPAGSEEFS